MEIISPFELYLWTRLDGLQAVFIILTVIASIGSFVAIMCVCMEEWPFNKALIVFGFNLFIIMCCVATPSKKDMAMIYVLPQIVNNEIIQQEAGEIYQLAKQGLQDIVMPVKEEK